MKTTSEQFWKAANLWYDFKKEVLYKNRFIIKHEILNHIEYFANKHLLELKPETILYRARAFSKSNSGKTAQEKNREVLLEALAAKKLDFGAMIKIIHLYHQIMI